MQALMQRRMHSVSERARTEPVKPKMAGIFSAHMLRLCVVVGLGVTLAACDKCIVPTWRHDTPAPQSCHDDAPVK
jgi:hypothetical protein